MEGALRLGKFHSALALRGLLEQPALGSESRVSRPVVRRASLTRSGSLRRRGDGSLWELRRLLPRRAGVGGGPEIRQDPRRRPAAGAIGNGPRASAGHWQSLHAGAVGWPRPGNFEAQAAATLT